MVSLSPGSRLGHYEIIDPIGKGGMGEVYKARDSKLGRDVAIKILPEALSQDPDRAERFEREARLLAQLNHSNIATLHGFEKADGRQFLVMELVEGETLAERIARRPLSLSEAASIFGQIADAIEAAHAGGIVHRDLKPANIKLAADGKPKILDFGLARAWAGDVDAGLEDSRSPTVTKGTELGAVMGTPAYMSPEQARGEAVDGRTDVWAFGCCLYEALTGRKAFRGETTADVFAAIMNEGPQCTTFPDRLQRLLGRCLEKDVHHRLRGLEHARLELAELTANPETSPRASRTLVPWLVALLAAVIAVASVLRPVDQAPEPSPVRFSLQLPPGDRLLTGFSGNLAVSPDGSQLAYVGVRGMDQYSLFVRSMDHLEPQPVPGTEGAGNPFFSPDGQSIGYTTVMGPLKTVAVGDGTSTELVDNTDFSGAFWADDGYIYFSPASGSGISRVPKRGGEPEVVVPVREELGDVDLYSPQLLPGANALLFVVRDRAGRDRIVAETLDTRERQVLVEDAVSPQYVRSGHLVFARDDKILAVPFDTGRLVAESDPIIVVDGLEFATTGVLAVGKGKFAVSDEGTLVYVDADQVGFPISQLVGVDREGAVAPLNETPRRFWGPRWSPDGKRLAIAIWGDEQQWDVWTYELSREILTRLTFDRAFRFFWSPDGTRLFLGNGSLDPNVGGEPTPLLSSEYLTLAASVSPDGGTLVYRQSRPETGWDIVFQHRDDGGNIEVYLATPFDELHPLLSPDGRYLAYTSNDSGRIEVFVDTFPRRSKKVQISNNGGTEPVWSPDGGELFYRNGNAMMRVSVTTEPEFSASKPSLLFEGNYLLDYIRQTANYDISPDGERFAMLRAIEGTQGSEISVVLNWFSELERLVPTED